MSNRKNDVAWDKLFEKYQILDNIENNGQFIIKAEQIREFREARLMTKFDHRSELPYLFRENNLSILPITRGSYSISNYKVYHKFEEFESPIIEMPYPDYIQSINWKEITSESIAINVAYATNILADFLGEEGLLPTVSGRMGSKKFDYYIYNNKLKTNQQVSVNKSQLEIDGGFEGLNSLALIEAKNILSEDFLVRQLYYPFRLWNNQIQKPVRPIYITYSNSVFSLYEYKFEIEDNYNSLTLVKSQRYTIRQEPIMLDDILEIYENTSFVEEDENTPFVQADSFYRVINMCELLVERKHMTKLEIAIEYGFADRQSDYYYNAGKYLGLMEKVKIDGKVNVILTELGKDLMKMTGKRRNLTLVKLILSHKVFYHIFEYYLKHNEYPELNDLITIMKQYPLNIGREEYEMYRRRSSSVTGWINWIFNLIRN